MAELGSEMKELITVLIRKGGLRAAEPHASATRYCTAARRRESGVANGERQANGVNCCDGIAGCGPGTWAERDQPSRTRPVCIETGQTQSTAGACKPAVSPNG